MMEDFSTSFGLLCHFPNLKGLKIRDVFCSKYFLDEGFCHGDDGGPLVTTKRTNDNSAVVYGIASEYLMRWNNKTFRRCANGESVYTKITEFLGWIKSHMKGTLQMHMIEIRQLFVTPCINIYLGHTFYSNA